MSGFLSPEAEAALLGEQEEARHLFYQNQAENTRHAGRSSYQPPSRPNFSPVMTSSQSQASQQAFVPPAQYVSWPSSGGSAWPALHPEHYFRSSFPATSTPIVPSTPYSSESWPNAPWPALHPDDVEAPSDISRSVSPNPADLHNFGFPLADGRTWRCAYPGCTSQAHFTRGCDLRKHFRRHTKSLFCRHENCPQSTEGGFSSKKDRDRHESKHRPGINCSQEGCERKFSRVDNMKDHVRRIHRKPS